MLKIGMVCLILFMALLFILLCRSRHSFERILYLGLLSAVITALIVLYAVYTGKSMYLDVALSFALLGFMDIQFYSVYLRKKGAL